MRPIVRIHDSLTGEIIDREMNDQEYNKYLVDVADLEAKVAVEQEKITAKNNLLERLGITEEEAKLLLS